MARRNTRGKGAKKPPRRAGPQKKGAKKPKKVTKSGASKHANRPGVRRKEMALRGRKATSLAQALGICPLDCEVLIRDATRLVETNGPAEEGCEGKHCRCLSLTYSSCKKHPSREKVRTGHFVKYPSDSRRAVWVPKVLVEKGIIKVKKDAKFRINKRNGKPL